MNEKILSLIAIINVNDAKRDFVKNEAIKLVSFTKVEKGCINYDLHQDITDPNVFIFYENWESREAWEAHKKTQHMLDFSKITKSFIEGSTLHQLTKINN